jgi:hypothetical protein
MPVIRAKVVSFRVTLAAYQEVDEAGVVHTYITERVMTPKDCFVQLGSLPAPPEAP